MPVVLASIALGHPDSPTMGTQKNRRCLTGRHHQAEASLGHVGRHRPEGPCFRADETWQQGAIRPLGAGQHG
jgi:hypothetical protein